MTKKLLLADDSITIQKVIGIIFATEDFQLVTCDNGKEALEKALEEIPDLVISDIFMPEMDGFELCQAIKSEPRLAHTSVLLLPGTFEHFDESKAEAAGADGWISKPFESQALLDKVNQMIEAEPVRISPAEVPAAEDVAAAEEPPEAAVEDVVVAPVEELVEEPVALQGDSVDDVALGLDQVDETAEPVAEEAGDDSAEDIWDAVSFEEEDLQQAEEVAPAAEESVVEPDPEVEMPEFGAPEEELELTEEALEDVEPVEPAVAEEPLELTEEVAEEIEPVAVEEEAPSFTAPAAEDEPLELTEEVVEDAEPVELADEVTTFAESAVEEEIEEEVLDLAEEDILEEVAEEFAEEVEEEPVAATVEEVVEEPVMAAPEEAVEDTVEAYAPEQADEVEETEDEGFYYDAADSVEEEMPLAEPAATIAAGTAVVAAAADDSSAVEQAEQQLRELSEDDLKDVVAKVAGPTIEKLANEMLEQIVWEVVPDLAESMIREEIRKIRQGAAE